MTTWEQMACGVAHEQMTCRGTTRRRLGGVGGEQTWWESPLFLCFLEKGKGNKGGLLVWLHSRTEADEVDDRTMEEGRERPDQAVNQRGLTGSEARQGGGSQS
jgi:hypothetical protein